MERIAEGDYVTVYLTVDWAIYGIVRRQPCATGDCWIIEEEKGSIFYVQTFLAIERKP